MIRIIEPMSENTSIPLKKLTRDQLKNLGKKGQTFDDLICKLLEKGGNS